MDLSEMAGTADLEWVRTETWAVADGGVRALLAAENQAAHAVERREAVSQIQAESVAKSSIKSPRRRRSAERRRGLRGAGVGRAERMESSGEKGGAWGLAKGFRRASSRSRISGGGGNATRAARPHWQITERRAAWENF
jgi:hypothetical protein